MNSGVHRGVEDVIEGLQNWRLWVVLGWKDIRLRYNRTIIGPFWQTLSMAIFVTTLGVLYAKFWKMDYAVFLPFLAIGMSAWVFISSVATEGCEIFIGSVSFIHQKRLPYSTFVFQLLLRNFLVFLHNLPVVLVVLLLFRSGINWSVLFLIPGLILVILNCFWIAILLGLLCARFRDFSNLVTSIVQVVFFITPIFWSADLIQGKRRLLFVDSNPVFHLIEVIRGPLLGYVPPSLTWIVTSGLAVGGLVLTLHVYGRFRSRIPYWL